ncbi:hypothetical protein GW17_00041073 [Ensete ventricosum]|nr:hypothetical protein GW17_00041073 [Ensete ventricosum]
MRPCKVGEVLHNNRKSCAKLIEVMGITNSNDSVLMQGLVHGRWSVHGHPKARLELSAIEHQNFLFDMKRIRLVGHPRPGRLQGAIDCSQGPPCKGRPPAGAAARKGLLFAASPTANRGDNASCNAQRCRLRRGSGGGGAVRVKEG